MKCYVHPEVEAVGVCMRCGQAVCRDCREEHQGRTLCADCDEGAGWAGTGFRFELPNFERMFDELFACFGRRCPECSKGVAPNFVVCPYCSAKLQPVCSECGEKLRPDWKACPYCGKTVDSAA